MTRKISKTGLWCPWSTQNYQKVLESRFWPINFANWTIWSRSKNFSFFVPSMVGPGCCPGMPIHEYSRSCLTSVNDENIRYVILSSQYSCIALLRHRLHDPSWALPAGVQKWRYSRNHGFTRFHGKSGSVSFFLLSMCNFMQKIKKILRAVFEKNHDHLTN